MDKFETKLVAWDELVFAQLQKYKPGSSFNSIKVLKESEIRIYEENIINDFGEKGYFYAGYRLIGPNRRHHVIFTRLKE